MTKDELSSWALANGWQMIAGHPSLTRPSRPADAIVRLVLKATVVQLEIKKPAGKWEKISSAAYSQLIQDAETGLPIGLGLDTITGFSALIEDNKMRAVFRK
jgi:predicted component of type VI protein secretion system